MLLLFNFLDEQLTKHLIACDITSSDSKSRIRIAVISVNRKFPIVDSSRKSSTRKDHSMLVTFTGSTHCVFGDRNFLWYCRITSRPRKPSDCKSREKKNEYNNFLPNPLKSWNFQIQSLRFYFLILWSNPLILLILVNTSKRYFSQVSSKIDWSVANVQIIIYEILNYKLLNIFFNWFKSFSFYTLWISSKKQIP